MKTRFDARGLPGATIRLEEWLSTLRPTTTVAVGPLRLVRLMGDPRGPDAVLLDEALAIGGTSVTEVSGAGVIAHVTVAHEGALPLLLLDGEQIVGAKQNRMINASFLIGPGQTVNVPVSCVERGRWDVRPRSFEHSDTTIATTARLAKLRRVHASLRGGRSHDADQHVVWEDVDEYLRKTGTQSGTAAFEDAYRRRRPTVEPTLSCFLPEDGQVGVALVYGETFLCLDLFGSPSLYERGWRKVVRGSLVDVYEERPTASEPTAIRIVADALRALVSCPSMRSAAPGLGETVHGTARGVTFTGIARDDVLFHAVATTSS
jgi:hypothetical protein